MSCSSHRKEKSKKQDIAKYCMKAYLHVLFIEKKNPRNKILQIITWKHICMSGSARRKQGFCLNVRLKLFSWNLCESQPDCGIVIQLQRGIVGSRLPTIQQERETFKKIFYKKKYLKLFSRNLCELVLVYQQFDKREEYSRKYI